MGFDSPLLLSLTSCWLQTGVSRLKVEMLALMIRVSENLIGDVKLTKKSRSFEETICT